MIKTLNGQPELSVARGFYRAAWPLISCHSGAEYVDFGSLSHRLFRGLCLRVCLSVCMSVRLSHAWIVTKREKDGPWKSQLPGDSAPDHSRTMAIPPRPNAVGTV